MPKYYSPYLFSSIHALNLAKKLTIPIMKYRQPKIRNKNNIDSVSIGDIKP